MKREQSHWRKNRRDLRLEKIRRRVLVGLQQLDAGEGEKWSLEDVKAKGRELLARRRSARL